MLLVPSVSHLDYLQTFYSKLQHFPDPIPGQDGHYKKFEEVFATDTVEEHRPSLQKITKSDFLSIQVFSMFVTVIPC